MQSHNLKNVKLDFHKILNFYYLKVTIKKVKRKAESGRMCKTPKRIFIQNIQRTLKTHGEENNLMKKMGKRFKKTFRKEEIWMGNNHAKDA